MLSQQVDVNLIDINTLHIETENPCGSCNDLYSDKMWITNGF